MENVTSKRRGRPAKHLADAENAGKVAINASHDDGNGQVSQDRIAAQAEPNGSSQGITWEDLVDQVAKAYKHSNVVAVWHPDPPSALHMMHDGVNLRVMQGEPAYQLGDGTKHKI